MQKSKQVARYVISGGGAAALSFVVLYIATEIFHIWYIVSVIIAFVFAFVVSFSLQKFWTFNNQDTTFVHRQIIYYLSLALLNIALNVLGVYVLVSKLGVWYMAAQFFTLGFLAIINFFIYKYRLFR